MKAIYVLSSGLEDWLEVPDRLWEELGWVPEYFITQPHIDKALRRRYPDAIFHLRTRGFQGLPPTSYPESLDIRYPIDRELLEELGIRRDIALQMMDKQDPGNVTGNHFTFRDRKHQLYRSLMYWCSVVDYIEPEVVVFAESPHNLGEYVLYSLANLRGIETIVYRQTKLPELFYTTNDLDDVPKPLKDISSFKPDVSSRHREYIERLQDKKELDPRGSDTGVSSDYINVLKKFAGKVLDPREIPKVISAIGREYELENQSYLFHNQKAFMSGEGKPPHKSSVSVIEWLYYRLKGKYYKKQLRNYYTRNTSLPDYSERYVYFPLHYQPERTTTPDGGIYADHYLVANLISYHLPDYWKIYVREHPAQWSDTLRGELGRTREFYDELLSMGNIRFIAPSESPYNLIDSSQAVVTITGTSAWEAVVRGKPAIVFGPHAWYRSCPGIQYVQTKDELDSAIRNITDGVVIREESIYRFVSGFESVGYEGHITPQYRDDETDDETNLDNLVKAITDKY